MSDNLLAGLNGCEEGKLAGAGQEALRRHVPRCDGSDCRHQLVDPAEVTVGGIDTDELSSKTMEAKKVPGLYFIGEVVDVTGWLGGYNFQWAWSSGWAAGQAV